MLKEKLHKHKTFKQHLKYITATICWLTFLIFLEISETDIKRLV